MITKTIKIPIYFGKLNIILTKDFKDVNKKFNKNIENNKVAAVTFAEVDKDNYFIVIKDIEWSVIAHEAVHIVNYIFLGTGVLLDRQNDESQAYLTGWVVHEVEKFLKENKKCKKN